MAADAADASFSWLLVIILITLIRVPLIFDLPVSVGRFASAKALFLMRNHCRFRRVSRFGKAWKLIEAAKPKRIIMFGSQARGEAGEDSDLDVMVVEELVSDRAGEMVRLSRLLRSFDIPVDLLVVSAEKFNYWCDSGERLFRSGHRRRSPL